MMCWKPSSRVKRSGPPNDSGVKRVQVLDVMRSPLGELGLQYGIGKGLRVEHLLEAVQRLVTPGMFVQACHRSPCPVVLAISRSGLSGQRSRVEVCRACLEKCLQIDTHYARL
jgi:hypothetical protein